MFVAWPETGPLTRWLGVARARLNMLFTKGGHLLAPCLRAMAVTQVAKSGRFPLMRFFGIGGFLLMSMAAGALTLHHYAHDKASMLRMAESQNSALARAFANEIWLRHGSYFASARGLDGDALRARPETAEIDAQVRKLVRGLPVMKVAIHDPNGLTIYSSDPAGIGGSKHGNPGFMRAVSTGHPESKSSFRGEFSAFSGVVGNVDLAETYVPLVLPTGQIGTVFELYTDITSQINFMTRDNILESAIIIGSMMVTFLGMLLVVYRADKVISRQHGELARSNAELSSAHALADGLNAKLNEKIVELERSNRDLKDFAQVAAHDLQEPLRKIEAFSQRLMSRYGDRLPDEGQMFVERMTDASIRMRQLITSLLAYARLNQEGQAVATVDLQETMRDVLSDLQLRIEETGADVRVGNLPTVVAIPSQMVQLTQNLIANALKFIRPGVAPVIEVSSRYLEGGDGMACVQIVVSDNGIGFDDKAAAKLFKLFHRLHGRSEYEGTGVGLATCRRIAENHGGTIAVSGVLGQGATFTVTLPVGTQQS